MTHPTGFGVPRLARDIINHGLRPRNWPLALAMGVGCGLPAEPHGFEDHTATPVGVSSAEQPLACRPGQPPASGASVSMDLPRYQRLSLPGDGWLDDTRTAPWLGCDSSRTGSLVLSAGGLRLSFTETHRVLRAPIAAALPVHPTP